MAHMEATTKHMVDKVQFLVPSIYSSVIVTKSKKWYSPKIQVGLMIPLFHRVDSTTKKQLGPFQLL